MKITLPKKIWLVLGIILALCLGIGLFFKVSKEKITKISLTTEEEITLFPNKKDSSGIDPEATFILSSKSPLPKKEISSALKIVPATPFTLKEKGENQWEIIPKVSLEKEKIYRFILSSLVGGVKAQELSWAFQIQTPFKIIGSLPAAKATEVPLNSSIEVYFNNPAFTGWENYFEITPKIEGRFEKHQSSLVFVSQNPLSPTTVYTVRVKKSLPLEDDSEKLVEDFVFLFETGQESKQPIKRFEFARLLSVAGPNSSPVILLNNYEIPTAKTKARIFRQEQDQFTACLKEKLALPSWSRFAQGAHLCQGEKFLISGMELEARRVSDYGQFYFSLPEKLAAGFYLLEVDNPGSSPTQNLLQVTSISWYFWIGEKESLFWVNDLENKQPIGGVVLSLENQEIARTDDHGFAKIQTPEAFRQKTQTILSLKAGDKIAFSPIFFGQQQSSWERFYPDSLKQISSENYWSYLYFDRSLYLPSDKINFWGTARHREKGKPEKLKVKLVGGTFEEATFLQEKEITPSASGTFSNSFEFKNLSPGWYSVGVFDGEILVSQKGFSIQTFTKPIYQISAVAEKNVIWAGEGNKIKVKVSFWDGTPVANTALAWDSWGIIEQKGEITTNAAGEGELSLEANFDRQNEYWPQLATVSFRPKLPEEGEIQTQTSFFVFGPEIELKGEAKRADNQGQVKIRAQRVDLKKREIDPWSQEGELMAGIIVNSVVYRRWYEQIETGEIYNPIEKIVEKQYRWEERTEEIQKPTGTTDQNGEWLFTFPASEDQEYLVKSSSMDGRGREARLNTWLGAKSQASSQEGLVLKTNQEKFKIGEEAVISLENNSQPVSKDPPNFYLLFTVQNGKILATQVQSEDKWRLKFEENFMPNVWVKAVWFNGEFYKESFSWSFRAGAGLNLAFDYSQKELGVEIKPEKEKYLPGEEAKINFAVKNSAGAPQKTKLLVAAVDESLSDLGAIEKPQVLAGLYRTTGEGRLLSYLSHISFKAAMAEGGGGGGARENFQNTALFREIDIGDDGKGELKFKLPDNITSWRITAIALDDSLGAGEAQLLLPVSKPILVNLVTAEEFLVADKPKISVLAFGEALSQDTLVKFTLSAPTLGLEKQVFEGKAFIPTEFSLPPLSLGEHKIELWAEAGNQKDGIVRKINILDSRLVKEKTETFSLDKELSFDFQTTKAVDFTVVDKGRGFWYPKLRSDTSIAVFGKNERADRIATQILAKSLLNQYFNHSLTIEEDLYRYQKNGGVALLAYGDEDLALSAKVAAAGIAQIDKNQLKKYFWKIFQEEQGIERASLALWGLAEVGEPVLNTAEELAAKENTVLGKLYLALASSALGDQSLARNILKEAISKYGVEEKPFVYLKVGQSKENYLEATALGLILSGRIGESKIFEGMMAYLEGNPSSENTFVLEEALGLKGTLGIIPPESGAFEYFLEGKWVKKELEPGGSFFITVGPEKLKEFKIKPWQGSLTVIGGFWEKLAPATVAKNSQLNISVSRSPSGSLSSFPPVEIRIETKIGKDALSGPYLVALSLPSGLRFVDASYNWNVAPEQAIDYSWPVLKDGNRLVFWNPTDKPIRFLARPVNKGSFIFEPTMIYQAIAVDSLNLSPSTPEVVIE